MSCCCRPMFPGEPALFYWSAFLMGTIAGAYGFFQFGILGAVGGFLGIGYLLPNSLLVLKKKHRLKKFEKQLPEALGLMSRSLKAGHSFPSSMQLVADEMANPIGLEFFKTFKEYNYGLDFSDVLMNLYTRNQLRDLKFFITAILIQRETGGNLVEILEKIAHLIRERFKLVNQIKALTAEGRLSGLILTFTAHRDRSSSLVYESTIYQHALDSPFRADNGGTSDFFPIFGNDLYQKDSQY